jgi:hypothetical protein
VLRRGRKKSEDMNDISTQDSFASPRSTSSNLVKDDGVDVEAQESPEAEYTHYRDAPLLDAATIIGTILASTLPMASILVLYSIESLYTRLYVSSIFTVIFSCAVRLVKSQDVRVVCCYIGVSLPYLLSLIKRTVLINVQVCSCASNVFGQYKRIYWSMRTIRTKGMGHK